MPQSQFNLSCLSRRGFIHSYMLKTSMTMSTYLYPLFHLLTCCMSTKSAGKFFLLIFIVDNHAYWFVVVLSFVLSRYKELIKLSLKKKCKSQTEGLKAGFHLTESDAEHKFCLWLCPLQFSIPCSFGNPKGKPKCPTSWSFLHDIDSAYHSYLREKQPQTIFLSCGYQWRKGKLIANNKVNVFHNV